MGTKLRPTEEGGRKRGGFTTENTESTEGDGDRAGNGRMVLALTRAGAGATAGRRVGGLWRGLAGLGDQMS